MKEKEKKLIEDEIKEYIDVNKIITNDRYKKNIYSSINLTSYNNKDIVLDTWDKVKNSSNEIDRERTFEDDLNEMFMQEKKELLYGLSEKNYIIDENSDNESIDSISNAFNKAIDRCKKINY